MGVDPAGQLARGWGRRGRHVEAAGPVPGQRRAGAVHLPGMNCIKIGLPGKLILSKGKGLWEIIFSGK